MWQCNSGVVEMKKRRRKLALTLVEMMIVIFIIGVISSVVGVNMKKSLEKGKHFKTTQAMQKLCDILELDEKFSVADIQDNSELKTKIQAAVKRSFLTRNSTNLLKDGWGKEFVISSQDDTVQFLSPAYEAYCEKNGLELDYPWAEDEKSE
ncbi:hypothetical protein COB21_02735 [Candidatus Aerophobetes bacterium]|uniref:Type II secretion system protein n=1 Tax=Aerophobetes bacterium TaxID=2030807 RepID=A0A2A4X5S1_UNCAE|nr:MAG: hypothetical protein COB21_02735 [Candidatus Aerophobetes bacterium]